MASRASWDTSRLSPSELAGTVCYLVQRPDQMFLQDSISADIGMFPRSRGLPDAAEITAEVLDRVGLSQVGDRDGRLLSGGQQRRATLAIGLAMRPTLLLLDEPTSSLDLRSRDDVIDMLDALAEQPGAPSARRGRPARRRRSRGRSSTGPRPWRTAACRPPFAR